MPGSQSPICSRRIASEASRRPGSVCWHAATSLRRSRSNSGTWRRSVPHSRHSRRSSARACRRKLNVSPFLLSYAMDSVRLDTGATDRAWASSALGEKPPENREVSLSRYR
jgi:hypothetical protein